MKKRSQIGLLFLILGACLSSNGLADDLGHSKTPRGYTNKSVHGNDPSRYYKHPGHGSFTGPFDYGTAGSAEPIYKEKSETPTGKCNCFTFDSTKSYDVDGQKLSVEWDFGDGVVSEQPVVKHCYNKAGDYNVSLTVRDSSGEICGNGVAMTKVSSNFPPTANAGDPVTACLGESVRFDASASSVSNPATYTWDFGDGETGEGMTATHAYQKPGNYRVRLVVDDGKNTECSVASALTSATIMDRVTVALSAEGKDSTCVNRALKFKASGTGGAKYRWDFGDGETLEGGSSVSHAYSKPGTYPVTVTADNGQGSPCSAATDRITVSVSESPVADAGENLVCCVGKDNVFDGSGSTGTGLTYRWDFGDGQSAEGVRVNHSYEAPGNYRVVLTVQDSSSSECNVSSDSFVANVNTKPEAVIEVR